MYVQMRVLSVMLSCFLSTGHIEELPLEGQEKPNPISFFIILNGLLEATNGPHWISSGRWLSFFFFFFFNPSLIIRTPSFLLLFGMLKHVFVFTINIAYTPWN